MRTLKVTMAQLNPTVGDLKGNRDKVLHAVGQARVDGSGLVVFPELVLTGYPPEDLLHQHSFIEGNLAALRSIVPQTRGLAALIGFVDKDKRGLLYNAAAVIADRKLVHIYHKIDLPNYGVFDEMRYFVAGQKGCVLDAGGGIRIGVAICEDIWLPTSLVYSKAYRDAVSLLVNISASPYHVGKLKIREQLVQNLAKKARTAVLHENLIGGQDELVFDGSSFVADSNGKIVIRQARFEECVQTYDIPVGLATKVLPKTSFNTVKVTAIASGLKTNTNVQVLKPENGSPEKEAYDALVLGTRDYMQKNHFQRTVIGLSGGIDSALVACLAVDATGRKNVLGVTMPSQHTSVATKTDAHLLAKNLGIDCIEIPIKSLYRVYEASLKKIFGSSTPDKTEENLQARIRGNLLMAISNKWGHLVLTTGNKSEMATGYCTLYGDMAGGFAVIKDIPKTLVYRLSRYRNSLGPKKVIPDSVLRRAPTAELRPDQKDQDSLPPYSKLDRFLEAYIEKSESIQQIVREGIPKKLAVALANLVDANEYKRRQAPPGIKITPRAFGKDRRMPLTNRYRAGVQ